MRVPYFFRDLNRDPDLKSYPLGRVQAFGLWGCRVQGLQALAMNYG